MNIINVMKNITIDCSDNFYTAIFYLKNNRIEHCIFLEDGEYSNDYILCNNMSFSITDHNSLIVANEISDMEFHLDEESLAFFNRIQIKVVKK